MKKRKKPSKGKADDPVETAFLLRYQQKWTVSAIAGHLAVNRKTIFRWLRLYADKSSRYLVGTRFKKTRPRTFGAETWDLVKQLKDEAPAQSAVAIHTSVKKHLGGKCASPETIRRILRDLGLSKGGPRDRKGYIKFERERPNELWQIDFKGGDYFGPLGKLSLLAILDDCSRFVVAARWCPTQEEAHVISLLREAFEHHGLPNEVVSDNGAQFKSLQGEHATRYCRLLALLGVKGIYHSPNHPQSKGNLERWFGTVMSSFVPEARVLVATRPRLTLAEFNKRFGTWLEWYNTQHRYVSLGRRPPAKVYLEHPKRVDRALTVVINWDAWVVAAEERTVSKQNVVSIGGKKYTLPPGHASTRVQVRKFDDRYEVYEGDTLVEKFYKSPGTSGADVWQERVISTNGTFKFKKRAYYVGSSHAHVVVRVQVAASGKEILVYAGDALLARLNISDGSAY